MLKKLCGLYPQHALSHLHCSIVSIRQLPVKSGLRGHILPVDIMQVHVPKSMYRTLMLEKALVSQSYVV